MYDADLLLVICESVDDFFELIGYVELMGVKKEEDHVSRVSELTHNARKVVVATDALRIDI